MKKNNEGFSLVELIVAVAILAIIAAGVGSLVVFCSRFFKKTSDHADVQSEAQLLESQLNNLIVDAERGVYSGGSTEAAAKGFSADAYIQVSNYDGAYFVGYDSATQRVYYETRSLIVDPSTGSVSFQPFDASCANVTDWNLMGENVSSFTVSTDKVDTDSLVVVEMELTQGETIYETVQNISLRNDVLHSDLPSDLYDGDPAILTGGEPSEVIVSCEGSQVVFVPAGNEAVFQALVLARRGIVSQDVTWSLGGSAQKTLPGGGTGPCSVIDSTGKVTVGADETNKVLTVTATAAGHPEIFGTATIIIPQIEGITINSYYSNPAAGEQVAFTATVTGTNVELLASTITWEIVDGASFGTITSNGVLTVNNNAPVGSIIKVKASIANVSDTASVEVAAVSSNDRLKITSASTELLRGATVQLGLKFDGEKISSASGVKWTIKNDAGLGNKISVSQSGVVTAAIDINYNNEYVIKVQAQVDDARVTKTTIATIEMKIPKVTLKVDGIEGRIEMTKGQTRRFDYELTGIVKSNAPLNLTSNPSISGTGGSFLYYSTRQVVVAIGQNLRKNKLDITFGVDNTSIKTTFTIYVDGNDDSSETYITWIKAPNQALSGEERANLATTPATKQQGDLLITYFKKPGDADNIYCTFNGKEYKWVAPKKGWLEM